MATVNAGEPRAATAHELALFRAIDRRRTHRGRFGPGTVRAAVSSALAAAGETEGVRVVVPGHLDQLARLLGFATRVLRDDRA